MKFRNLLGLVTIAAFSAQANAQCGSATPDAGEVVDGGSGTNNFCTDTSLPTIAPGSYTNYYIETNRATNQYIDEDFWAIDIPDGETITIDIFFNTSLADVDLFLYDANVHSPCTSLTVNLGQGFSTSNDENVTYTNTSGSTINGIIRVNAWTGHNGSQDCNTYDLEIDLTGSGNVPYCGIGSANSVGTGATIALAPSGTPGNTIVNVAALPNQPGVLYYGPTQINLPFGCGTRCVGGTVVRLSVEVPVGGAVSYDEAIPSGSNTQFWYRDPAHMGVCGDVFNLSEAIAVP